MAETLEQQGAFEVLLDQCRDLVCGRLSAAVSGMLDKAPDALDALIMATQAREARELYQDARKVVAGQRQKLETEFQKFYLTEFRNRILLVRDPAHTFPEQMMSLKLVGDDDLQETLAFREMAGKLRRYCEEELAALDQRVGVLLGDANLNADMNPFSPQAMCDAWQQASRTVSDKIKVRGELLKLFDDHVIDALRSIFKEVNALLVKNSILPKIRYGVSKSKDGKRAGAHGEEDEAPEEAAAAPAEAEANVFSLLQNLVASGGIPGLGAAPALAPGQVPLQGAELLGSLTQIQQGALGVAGAAPAAGGAPVVFGTTNVLHELKAGSVGSSMAQMDAMTLDIVAMLFDQLFDDPKIPIGLKGLIGRLQIPMLKVAIADKAFFSKKTHPARLALDRFGEIALRLPPDFGPSSPLFGQLEEIVQQLLDGFQEDMAIFERVEEQLRSVIEEDERRIEAESHALAERAAQAESLAVAKTAAEDEVRARVQAHKLPGFVLEFLIEHWLKLLLLVHAKAGSGSTGWKNALSVLDQLVWSVEPKATAEERRTLAAAVSGLVRNIGAGLNALGVDEASRAAFFGALMKVHTEILSAKAAPAAPGAKPPEPASLNFTAQVTVRNPYGGGQVQVSGVDSGIAPENLVVGTWVEFHPKDAGKSTRAAKVLFVTPKKTRYVFADRKGKDMVELTRSELVRQLRTGELVRLPAEPEQPLFDRIMGGLVQKLKAPAAAKKPSPAPA